MALTEFQKAFLKNILVPKTSVIDPDTGEPVDWENLGGAAVAATIQSSAPTVNDDSSQGYEVGSKIVQLGAPLVTSTEWLCVDATIGAAIWVNLREPIPTGIEDQLDVNEGQGDARTKRISPHFQPIVGSTVIWTLANDMTGGTTTGIRFNNGANVDDSVTPAGGSEHSMVVPSGTTTAFIYLWNDGGYSGIAPGTGGVFSYFPQS